MCVKTWEAGMSYVEFKDVTKVYSSGEVEITALNGISFCAGFAGVSL